MNLAASRRETERVGTEAASGNTTAATRRGEPSPRQLSRASIVNGRNGEIFRVARSGTGLTGILPALPDLQPPPQPRRVRSWRMERTSGLVRVAVVSRISRRATFVYAAPVSCSHLVVMGYLFLASQGTRSLLGHDYRSPKEPTTCCRTRADNTFSARDAMPTLPVFRSALLLLLLSSLLLADVAKYHCRCCAHHVSVPPDPGLVCRLRARRRARCFVALSLSLAREIARTTRPTISRSISRSPRATTRRSCGRSPTRSVRVFLSKMRDEEEKEREGKTHAR